MLKDIIPFGHCDFIHKNMHATMFYYESSKDTKYDSAEITFGKYI